MNTNPDRDADFDGCNRECRKAGAHTLRWGGCEHAPRPEPTVSMSRVYTDPADGYPSIGYDTYTVAQLGELITAGLRTSDLPVNGDDLVDVGLVAARAIVHRNDDPPAVPVPPPTDQTAEDHRLALSMALNLGTGAPWDAIHDRATELGLPPLDQDPVARRLGLLAAYRAKLLTEAADALDADMERFFTEWPDEPRNSPYALGRKDAVTELRRLAAEAPTTTKPEADDTVHACPGRWGGPNCRCFDAESAAGVGQDGAQPQEERHG